MDFVAVPAGTARVAALALRGADPSLSFATADGPPYLVELNARLRREADSGMVAAARAVAAEKKEQPPLPPLP